MISIHLNKKLNIKTSDNISINSLEIYQCYLTLDNGQLNLRVNYFGVLINNKYKM